MRIACIDDMPRDGEGLLALVNTELAKYSIDVQKADYYASPESFFETWRPGMYRLIFLDIFLDTANGINIGKVIKRIDPCVLLVFCSSSNEFASESYEVQANYYLVKPVEEKAIAHMIHRLNLLKSDEAMLELPDHSMLLLSQLLYSEYHNHKVTFYLKAGNTSSIWIAQSELVKLLEPFGFFLAVTPGTIVNMKEVKAVEGDVFRMSNGSSVPISKRKKNELIQSYKNFLFSELRKDET